MVDRPNDLVLVVDQFEEVFTLADEAERAWLIAALITAASAPASRRAWASRSWGSRSETSPRAEHASAVRVRQTGEVAAAGDQDGAVRSSGRSGITW